MPSNDSKVVCVQHNPDAQIDKTACGWFVTFRRGSAVRMPDCPECLRALHEGKP
jgi:hypothetical protein